MKILGNPGPGRITIVFEEGEFIGKSVTMDADPIVGGVAMYASTISRWNEEKDNAIDSITKNKLVELIRNELAKNPLLNSEVVD